MTTRIMAVSTQWWLSSYDPDAHAPDTLYPTGEAEFVPDKSKAMAFVSKSDAFDFWWQQSKITPRRPDGKANRPLTAFDVEFVDD